MIAVLTFFPALHLMADHANPGLWAWLVELFPSRTRYTSVSIPYHLGVGYAGSFLAFISQYIVARTGDPFAGFWYALSITVLALIAAAFFLPETSGRDLD